MSDLHREPLGVIDVDAQTGDVKPLNNDQLENLRVTYVLLSNIGHQQQRRESDCLIPCCQMVLAYLGILRTYDWLSKVLETTAIGTPFFHVKKLSVALSVVVELGNHALLCTI